MLCTTLPIETPYEPGPAVETACIRGQVGATHPGARQGQPHLNDHLKSALSRYDGILFSVPNPAVLLSPLGAAVQNETTPPR